MHGVRQEPLGDRRWTHDLRRHARRYALVGQSSCGVLGSQQFANLPRRILQRGGYRVPTIHDDWTVGIAAQALAARALKPPAPFDLLASGAGFRTGAVPSAGRESWH